MAQKSGFFNSYQGDRKYYVSFLAEYFSSFIGNGIFFGGNYLKVNAYGGNMDIKVETGKAWINGYYYSNYDAAYTMSIEKADKTIPRVDVVVLRLDLTEPVRAVTLAIKKGTPAGSPTPQPLQRDNAIYELKLAEVRVNSSVTQILQSNITDFRLNKSDCGVVTSQIPSDFDLTELFNQYMSYWRQKQREFDEQAATQQQMWQQQMTSQQQEFEGKKNEFQQWFTGVQTNIAELKGFDFDNWFDLDGTEQTEVKGPDGVWTTTYKKNGLRFAEKIDNPKDSQGRYITKLMLYEGNGNTIKKSVTVTQVKNDSGQWVTNIVKGG